MQISLLFHHCMFLNFNMNCASVGIIRKISPHENNYLHLANFIMHLTSCFVVILDYQEEFESCVCAN